MAKFNWNSFEEEFIQGVAYSINTPPKLQPRKPNLDRDNLITTMEDIAVVPSSEFVLSYRDEIERFFLKKQPDMVKFIYKQLGYSTAGNYLGMLNELSAKPLGSRLVTTYLNALMEIGTGQSYLELISEFSRPVKVDLTRSQANELSLFDFQEDAVARLEKHFIKQDHASGLLVMPTGGGKTRTAAYFLLKFMISQGYQVIWLTHRHMLIDQAADTFFTHAPLIKLMKPETKRFKMTCVSGEHSSIRVTEKDDQVLILSIQSTCRSLDYLRSILAKKVIIVVDEAHHTVALSYRNTINHIRKIRKDCKLLGLTATPIRGTDEESRYLFNLFDNTVIYDIPLSELIVRQILADPIFEQIDSEIDFEPEIGIDEARLLRKYGELPPTLADKIARSSKRNQLIVDTYLKNKERYGKTLIFALNTIHCFTLCEELKKHDVRCDFIYSGQKDNEAKIRRFKASELDVLININILTEGSDVPDIQTVFLTRPTQSEGLLMKPIAPSMALKPVWSKLRTKP